MVFLRRNRKGERLIGDVDPQSHKSSASSSPRVYYMVFQLVSMVSLPKWRDGPSSTLNVAIEALNLTKEASPAKAVCGSVSALLTMIRDSMANEQDYVELGLNCADVCKALDRGLNGRQVNDLNESVRQAIKQFTATVATIQEKVVQQGKRNFLSRILQATGDNGPIASWRQDLTKLIQIFNTELAISTRKPVVTAGRPSSRTHGQHRSPLARVSGELPPKAPRTCFGRDELIEKVVGFAQHFEPIALIGAGGIGKTSIALTVLHHDRIKDKFGGNRRFIRCDQFPASRAHFLARLSKAIGAEAENPEDLIPLRPFLSSREIFIVLDNAESVLDPKGSDSRDIYDIVDELCQFKTICLCITSRTTTVPRHCKLLEIPMLSIEAARDMFYSIHADSTRSGIVDDLLRRLDFHALSITLLATTASHNMWDYSELAKQWEMQREKVLSTRCSKSLAATIELSLAGPTFRNLGADARSLLEVVAFFPQGVDERNFDLFFPTVSDQKDIFDKFSLTHRTNGFMTMLAPIRDYFCPQDPKSSPFLCAVKVYYCSRLSVSHDPDEPGFEEGKWIKTEDVNVEHLLDVFTGTPIDTNADDIWVACAHFLKHLYWHKTRRTVLGPKIIGLPDDHPYKPNCLFELSTLFQSVGNYAEQKRLLYHASRLYRQRGNDNGVAAALGWLSETNRMLKLFEGTRQTKKNLEILEQLDRAGRAKTLLDLSFFVDSDGEFDSEGEAAPHTLKILPEKGREFKVCQSHCFLGDKHLSRGDRKQAIQHFEKALRIASTFSWRNQLFGVHNYLAELFLDEEEFGKAQVHIEKAKSAHAVGGDTYELGVSMVLQASSWFRQNRLEEARSEALGALEIFEKLGAMDNVWACRYYVQRIEQAMKPSENSLW